MIHQNFGLIVSRLYFVALCISLNILSTGCDSDDQVLIDPPSGGIITEILDARASPNHSDMIPDEMSDAELLDMVIIDAEVAGMDMEVIDAEVAGMDIEVMDADVADTGLGGTEIDTNQPPVFNPVRRQRAQVGELISFTISAMDDNPESLVYTAGSLPNGAVFNPNDQSLAWTPSVAQGGQTYMLIFTVSDGELGDLLNVQVNVDPGCTNGEYRQRATCGYDECQEGIWTTSPIPITEICNGYDDDCDQVIDESAAAMASECCEGEAGAANCYGLSYCNELSCISLPQGLCNLDGDCQEGELCIQRECTRDNGVSSCQSPIPYEQAIVTANGLASASQLRRAQSGCLVIDDGRLGVNEGSEVVFIYETELDIMQPFELNASVSVNGVLLPITLSITTDCNATPVPFACQDNYNLGTNFEVVRLMFQPLPRQQYYLVLDTLGSFLQDELTRQGVGLEAVEYRIAMR